MSLMLKHTWMLLAVLALACAPGQAPPSGDHEARPDAGTSGPDAGEDAPDPGTDAGDDDPMPEDDDLAPVILGLTVAPARAAEGDEVIVRFSVDEPVEDVTALVGLYPAACVPDGDAYSCRYDVRGDEPEGVQLILVEAVDAAGNQGSASEEISFDYSPPAFTSISMEPNADGASVTVAFMTQDAGEVSYTCALNEGTAFPCVSPYTTPALPNGQHDLYVTTTDDVGHHTMVLVGFTIPTATPDSFLDMGIPPLSNPDHGPWERARPPL